MNEKKKNSNKKKYYYYHSLCSNGLEGPGIDRGEVNGPKETRMKK
jgi:hypothetical protein